MKFIVRRRVLAAVAVFAAGVTVPFATPSPGSRQTQGGAGHEIPGQRVFPDHGNGAKDYQKQHSSEFTLVSNGIKDETDTSAQIKIVEQMIVSKADAIVLAPADSKALVPVVKKAIDAGIIVINIDNQLDPGVLKDKGINVPFVGPDNRKGRENDR